MEEFAAARLADPLAHKSLWALAAEMGASAVMFAGAGIAAGMAATAIVGGAIAMVGLTVATGGVAGVLAAAAVATAQTVVAGAITAGAGKLGLFSAIDRLSKAAGDWVGKYFPPEHTGKIAEGSPDVFINGRPAARAIAEGDENKIACTRHPGGSPTYPYNEYLAEGSSSVFINGAPAARTRDRTTCGAFVAEGSPNVRIGGAPKATREVGEEVPWWLKWVSVGIGIVVALCKRDYKSIPAKLACLGIKAIPSVVAGGIAYVFGDNPVHAASGAKILDGDDDTDFELPARLPLTWVRRYNSLDTRTDGLFGQGWSVPVSVQLKLNQPGEYPHLFIDEQGREIPFTALAPNESLWNSAEGYRLARSLGGHYLIEDIDGLFYDFGEAHSEQAHTLALQRLEDRNRNALALRYDAHGHLAQIADDAGRLYHCLYHREHPSRLAGIEVEQHTGSRQRLVHYAYDAAGRLISVIDTLGQTTRQFTYHDTGPGRQLLASHTLPTGLTCFYDWEEPQGAPHPRVVRCRTSEHQHWRANYDLNAHRTTVTDHLGRVQQWTWNARYQVTGYTDALGRSWQLDWDNAGQLINVKSPAGHTEGYAYNARGLLTQHTDALGRQTLTEWHPDFSEIIRETLPDGTQWTTHYDGRGNLIAEEAPEHQRTTWQRDAHGQPVGITDARGGFTALTWNRAGQLLTHTDCSGRTTETHYDEHGNVQETRDALGHITRTEHDAAGQLRALKLPDGSTRHWRYNRAGQITDYRDGLGQIERTEHDAAGQVQAEIDAAGQRTLNHRNSAGQLTSITNPNGQTYRFTYNAVDECVGEQGLDEQTQAYTLDVLGLPTEVREAAGTPHEILTELIRDAAGRLTEKRTPETITTYHYGLTDQLLRVVRSTKSGQPIDEISWDYDGQGRPLAERTRLLRSEEIVSDAYSTQSAQSTHTKFVREQTIQSAYDVLGNKIATTLPDGRQLKTLTYGSGHVHQIALDEQVIGDFERDALHREVSRTQGQLATHTHYDGLSRKTATVAHAWQQRLLKKSWQYDANGELTRRTDDVLSELAYAYDPLGRLISATHRPAPAREVLAGQAPALSTPPFATEAFAFDAASNLLPQPAFQPSSPSSPPTFSQGRIENNRLRVFEDKRFDYDVYGRLKTKRSGAHTVQHFSYNIEHQLVEVLIEKQGVAPKIVRYQYDALGRRIAKHDANGSTWFIWDGLQLLQETRNHALVTYVYAPDSDEALARIEDTINDAHWRPEEQRHNQIYYFHPHINGAPEEMTSSGGQVVWQARYKVWGGLLQETDGPYRTPSPEGKDYHPLPQNLRFQGQYFDAETGLHYNTFRYYDPDVGRFTTEDPIGLNGGLNLYQYAPNPFAWIDPWGLNCKGKGKEQLKNAGLGKLNLAKENFNSGRKKLEKLGFKIKEKTKTGRVVFEHPTTKAKVFFDGTPRSLVKGQRPHWEIVTIGGDRLSRSGRVIKGESQIMGGKHIPSRK